MSRYYFHLQQGTDLYEDDEGTELMNSLRSMLGEAMRFGSDLRTEVLIIADEHGRQLAAIPITAALPPQIIALLHTPAASKKWA
jgi:hypothetical protein